MEKRNPNHAAGWDVNQPTIVEFPQTNKTRLCHQQVHSLCIGNQSEKRSNFPVRCAATAIINEQLSVCVTGLQIIIWPLQQGNAITYDSMNTPEDFMRTK